MGKIPAENRKNKEKIVVDYSVPVNFSHWYSIKEKFIQVFSVVMIRKQRNFH